MYSNRGNSYYWPTPPVFHPRRALPPFVTNAPVRWQGFRPPLVAASYGVPNNVPHFGDIFPPPTNVAIPGPSMRRPQQNFRRRPSRMRSWRRPQMNTRSRSRHNFVAPDLSPKVGLNPNDPLNLQELMKETERRRVQGLSPLRGDSRLNTPAVSGAGDSGDQSPSLGNPIISEKKTVDIPHVISTQDHRRRGVRRTFSRRRRNYRLPITGNYFNYYSRRDPCDRLQFLMQEWFSGKDVADYGCHNGTLTFSVLEKFPDVKRIDAFDCDVELIANAKSMQRERLRWESTNGIQYDKINFRVANWINISAPIDEPEYDTILAFSVTKWIHINHGDAGLMRFFRRAFNLLKPGGHLLLEPQPKASYRRSLYTAKQRSTFKRLSLDPCKLEPLLVELGFSYFDTIKVPKANEPFRRKIILCSKSYGATPSSIRNDFRSVARNWSRSYPSPGSPRGNEPPPVHYCPQSPSLFSRTAPIYASPSLHSQSIVSSSSTSEQSDTSVRVTNTSDQPDSPALPDSTSVT